MILKSIGPFDYRLSTKVITTYFPQVYDYMEDNKYRHVFRIENKLYLIEAKFEFENKDFFVEVNCLNSECLITDYIAQKMRWILSLDVDLTPFYGLLETHPIMKEVKNKLFGMKLLRSFAPYEAIIEAIIEQQISKKASMTLRKRLAMNYCDCVLFNGTEYYEFPKPEVLALAKNEDLRALGINNNKILAIKAISELECLGKLEKILNKPAVDIFSELSKIKGIGKWTIQYSLIRGLGRYNIPLEKDTALRSGVDLLFGKSYFKTDRDLSNFLGKYKDFAGYAAFYIIYASVLYKEAPLLFAEY